jgi:hypothetical protein
MIMDISIHARHEINFLKSTFTTTIRTLNKTNDITNFPIASQCAMAEFYGY